MSKMEITDAALSDCVDDLEAIIARTPATTGELNARELEGAIGILDKVRRLAGAMSVAWGDDWRDRSLLATAMTSSNLHQPSNQN